MDVKTYELGGYDGDMIPVDGGDWVSVEDYKRLRAENRARAAERDRAQQVCRQLCGRIATLEGTLTLIAAPMRPDGTWNRDREACRQLADAALRGEGDQCNPE